MRLDAAFLKGNHAKGRKSPYPVDTIVIHVTEGSEASVRSWFNNPAAQVSSHYLITKAGGIVALVKETDTAWHAGRTDHPTAAIVLARKGANVNGYSIGIEHEGKGTEELTDAQRTASTWLIRDICTRYRIPMDRRHIIGHREVFSRKTCPGKIDVDRLVSDAQGRASIAPPRIVYSRRLDDYLIVTRESSDTDWSYVAFKSLPPSHRGTTPLSTFANIRPGKP